MIGTAGPPDLSARKGDDYATALRAPMMAAGHALQSTERSARAVAAIWALTITGLLGGARLMLWYWPGSFFDSAAGGIWTSLASDLLRGEFYRPLLSPIGYGGTRYMPLLFIIDGALLRAHADPIVSGVVVMQATVVMASLALYAALRANGVAPRLALPLSGTPWATLVYQKYCTGIRPDYLAASFAMFALAAAQVGASGRSRRWLACASVASALGGLTKITAIVFVAPIAVATAVRRGLRPAVRYAVGATALFGAGVAAVQLASAGRFLESMRNTVTAGMTVSDLWRHGVPSFAEQIVDPFLAVPFALAVVPTFRAFRTRTWSAPHAYFATSAVLTLVILASPGTTANHMVDIHLASTLIVGIVLERGQFGSRAVAPAYVALALVMCAMSVPIPGLPSVIATLRARGPFQREAVLAMHHDFLSGPGGYVSEDPIVAVLNGERPVVADAFNLELFLKEQTPAGVDFQRRVEAREFGAIVLRDTDTFPHDMGPGDSGFDELKAKFWRKPSLLVRVARSTYEIRAVRRPFVVLTPIATGGSPRARPAAGR